MTGRHKFSELESSMTPERRARIDRMAEELAVEMDLTRSRKGRQPWPTVHNETLDIEQPAMADSFAGFIQHERDRLSTARESIFEQQQELKEKLANINRELAAIDAYEAAKTEQAAPGIRRAAARLASQRGRRGSRREAILQLIKDNPSGLSRGEILQHMNLKGNHSGEMAVSNTLTALTKENQVSRRDRKYLSTRAT
jgi:hypothetical protein